MGVNNFFNLYKGDRWVFATNFLLNLFLIDKISYFQFFWFLCYREVNYAMQYIF